MENVSHQVSGDEHSALVLLQFGHCLQPLVLTQTTCRGQGGNTSLNLTTSTQSLLQHIVGMGALKMHPFATLHEDQRRALLKGKTQSDM